MFIGGPKVLSVYQRDDSEEFMQALKNVSINENFEVIVLDDSGSYKNLPSVGTVCELSKDVAYASYMKAGLTATVVAHFKVYDDQDRQCAAIVVKHPDGYNVVQQVIAQCLRPKKTLEQIEHEAREKLIDKLINDYGCESPCSNAFREGERDLIRKLILSGYIQDDL